MELSDLINRDIACSCGRTHRCNIGKVVIEEGALEKLPSLIEARRILLLSDSNTYIICGDEVRRLLKNRISSSHCYESGKEFLVPDETAVAEAEKHMTNDTDMVLGIGSGVINDICKYVSFAHNIPCGIIATAPSMDGFASSGAAMIFEGMKVTFTTHAPDLILADTSILATAPSHMIAAGYADIIGKYSALCDWKLSALVNGEYICPFIYDLVMKKTDDVRRLASALTKKEPKALAKLTEALVIIGVCLTLLSTTRPGSGSEHHLSHYFEIKGLIDNRPHFIHGLDVGYATAVTAGMRERILSLKAPAFHKVDKRTRYDAYSRIYKHSASEVIKLQEDAGRYDTDMTPVYTEKWQEIREILLKCPTEPEIIEMLSDVGMEISEFYEMYGEKCIRDGMLYGKDLKDRYSVLWLYFDLFGGLEIKDSTMALMRNSFKAEARALEMLYNNMDEDAYAKALSLLKESSLTVLSACGSSGFTAKKFAHSLCCVEHPAKFVPPSEAVHGGMGALKKGNLLILVTKGGRSEELLPIAKIARKKGANLLLVTAHPEREIGQLADVVLTLPDTPESDRFDMMSTSSFVATIGIFDALMMGLMEEDSYTPDDFAVIHPGGAVGKRIDKK